MQSHSPHNRRIPGYDILRIIAILAVVSIHVLMRYRDSAAATDPVSIADSLLHFAVPVFFFVTGALVWGTGRGTDGYLRFLGKRARVILIPYCAWSAVYLTISAQGSDWTHVLVRLPILLLTGKAWYHLYFIPTLFLFYALGPILYPLVRRRPEVLVVLAYAVRIFCVSAGTKLVGALGGPLVATLATVVLTHLSDVSLGAWFAVRRDTVIPWLTRLWPLLISSGMALLAVRQLSLLPGTWYSLVLRLVVPLGMALVTLGLAGLAFWIHPTAQIRHRLARLGELTFGVYLMHPLFVLALNASTAALGIEHLWSNGWFTVASIACVTLASFSVSLVLDLSPRTSWLVGGRRHRQTPAPAPGQVVSR